MFYVYIGCLAFGTLYAVLSAVLGSHGFDDGGGLDHHIGVDHQVDVGVHDGVDSGDVPSPLNPVVIASAIATFGASGIIGKMGLEMGELPSAIFASACAGAVGIAVFFGIVKVLYNSQSNSNFSQEELIELEAEILTPIPAQGVGEIVYVAGGIRHSLPARSKNNEFIGRGEKVIIQDIKNHTAFVTKKITINEFFTDGYETLDEGYEKGSSLKRDDNNMREV